MMERIIKNIKGDFAWWAFCLPGRLEDFWNDWLKPALCALVMFAALCLIVILCMMPSYKREIEKYNEGVCAECGQQFVLKEAVGHRNSTTHIFQCENCGKLIELEYYNPLND